MIQDAATMSLRSTGCSQRYTEMCPASLRPTSFHQDAWPGRCEVQSNIVLGSKTTLTVQRI